MTFEFAATQSIEAGAAAQMWQAITAREAATSRNFAPRNVRAILASVPAEHAVVALACTLRIRHDQARELARVVGPVRRSLPRWEA